MEEPGGRALTGAWIETGHGVEVKDLALSRALTGAWIETQIGSQTSDLLCVAPSRARGLKHYKNVVNRVRLRRALTGAWIETSNRFER